MTANLSIDPELFLHEQLAQASPDLMRDLLSTFVNTLLSAQADSVCGAEYGTRSAERSNRRNGYRHRDLDTRVGLVVHRVAQEGCAADRRWLRRRATASPVRACGYDRLVWPHRDGLIWPLARLAGVLTV